MALTGAQRQARYRERRKAERTGKPAPSPLVVVDPPAPPDPARALAEWSLERLRVPPGHAFAGQPMQLPPFAVTFLRDALKPGIREAGLFVARKNAKSAIVAVLLLGFLASDGPLRRRGFRAGVASVNREKAGELWQQCQDIALASFLPLAPQDPSGIRFGKVPRSLTSPWGRCDFLSADASAGHAAGFDIAVVDELGLFEEKGRPLVAGMLSSTSARDGRMVSISVLGHSPLTAELVDRKEDPAVAIHVYAAPKDCSLDDEAAWRAANPGLAEGIKSRSYMEDMARRAAMLPSEQSNFRVYDLNQPGDPQRQPLVELDRWNAVANKRKPERSGDCFVGFDIGGSTSMTAAAAYWPATGRLDTWGAFGDTPSLLERGEADGVGRRYQTMQDRGELRTWPGRVTPCAEFLEWIALELADETISRAAADRWRQAEAEDALEAAGVSWPVEWRAQGSGKDGSADIRHFQRAVVGGTLRPGDSLLLRSAIAESALKHPDGNPSLEKARQKGRIDSLSAAVLAVGLGARAAARTRGGFVIHLGLDGEMTALGG